jgi:hypothetical protein
MVPAAQPILKPSDLFPLLRGFFGGGERAEVFLSDGDEAASGATRVLQESTRSCLDSRQRDMAGFNSSFEDTLIHSCHPPGAPYECGWSLDARGRCPVPEQAGTYRLSLIRKTILQGGLPC